MSSSYQSPYAALNTDQRFATALKLATQYHLDVSEVMFTYLKVAEPELRQHPNAAGIPDKVQRRIDAQFEQTLKALQLKES
jgi:hypothetical protein